MKPSNLTIGYGILQEQPPPPKKQYTVQNYQEALLTMYRTASHDVIFSFLIKTKRYIPAENIAKLDK